jgi:hypothetical protein
MQLVAACSWWWWYRLVWWARAARHSEKRAGVKLWWEPGHTAWCCLHQMDFADICLHACCTSKLSTRPEPAQHQPTYLECCQVLSALTAVYEHGQPTSPLGQLHSADMGTKGREGGEGGQGSAG